MYKNLNYTDKVCCWQWHRNRDDSLETIEKNFETNQIVENYANGRCDSLKCNNKSFMLDSTKQNRKLFFFDDCAYRISECRFYEIDGTRWRKDAGIL